MHAVTSDSWSPGSVPGRRGPCSCCGKPIAAELRRLDFAFEARVASIVPLVELKNVAQVVIEVVQLHGDG